MTTTKNRFLYLAAATALGLTLASCSGDTGGDETTDGAADSDQTTSEQTEGGDAEGEGDDAADDEGDDAGAAAGAECLMGSWEMTAEAMEEQVLAQGGGEGEASVEGTSTMTFDGTTLTTDQDNTSTYSTEVEGVAVESETTTDATIVVNYTADDATITYNDVVSADGTISITVGGTTHEQDAADAAGLMAGQVWDYTCTEGELNLKTDVSGIGVEITLTRA